MSDVPLYSFVKRVDNIWAEFKLKGSENIFGQIFGKFQDKSYIVDSSKDCFWIRKQASKAKRFGLDVRYILIWKTPLEFAYSKYKRGSQKWINAWKNYHKLYFSLIENFYIIKYSDFAKNPKGFLEKTCSILNINYFEGKELFWKFKHHTLFGNNSAKIHLYSTNNDIFKKYKNRIYPQETINDFKKKFYRKFYYENELESRLPDIIAKDVYKNEHQDRQIKLIENYLDRKKIALGVGKEYQNEKDYAIKFSIFSLLLYKYRYQLNKILSKLYERKNIFNDN